MVLKHSMSLLCLRLVVPNSVQLFLPELDQERAYFSRQQDTQPHSSLEVSDSQLSVSSEEFWDKPCGVSTQLLAEEIETSNPLCSLSKACRCQLQGKDSQG